MTAPALIVGPTPQATAAGAGETLMYCLGWRAGKPGRHHLL